MPRDLLTIPNTVNLENLTRSSDSSSDSAKMIIGRFTSLSSEFRPYQVGENEILYAIYFKRCTVMSRTRPLVRFKPRDLVIRRQKR